MRPGSWDLGSPVYPHRGSVKVSLQGKRQWRGALTDVCGAPPPPRAPRITLRARRLPPARPRSCAAVKRRPLAPPLAAAEPWSLLCLLPCQSSSAPSKGHLSPARAPQVTAPATRPTPPPASPSPSPPLWCSGARWHRPRPQADSPVPPPRLPLSGPRPLPSAPLARQVQRPALLRRIRPPRDAPFCFFPHRGAVGRQPGHGGAPPYKQPPMAPTSLAPTPRPLTLPRPFAQEGKRLCLSELREDSAVEAPGGVRPRTSASLRISSAGGGGGSGPPASSSDWVWAPAKPWPFSRAGGDRGAAAAAAASSSPPADDSSWPLGQQPPPPGPPPAPIAPPKPPRPPRRDRPPRGESWKQQLKAWEKEFAPPAFPPYPPLPRFPPNPPNPPWPPGGRPKRQHGKAPQQQPQPQGKQQQQPQQQKQQRQGGGRRALLSQAAGSPAAAPAPAPAPGPEPSQQEPAPAAGEPMTRQSYRRCLERVRDCPPLPLPCHCRHRIAAETRPAHARPVRVSAEGVSVVLARRALLALPRRPRRCAPWCVATHARTWCGLRSPCLIPSSEWPLLRLLPAQPRTGATCGGSSGSANRSPGPPAPPGRSRCSPAAGQEAAAARRGETGASSRATGPRGCCAARWRCARRRGRSRRTTWREACGRAGRGAGTTATRTKGTRRRRGGLRRTTCSCDGGCGRVIGLLAGRQVISGGEKRSASLPSSVGRKKKGDTTTLRTHSRGGRRARSSPVGLID